ncbi:MAG: aminodeoxychorismate/anthranilate synthase component II [Candidatus Omnitrophica bacterium]|nr:aminodeoxychorismate/anthranilate synthase component II [Candidatus Omnitrophota bacterium]
MYLMIDNYDSFTYNLVQYFAELGADFKVFRNDEITIEEIKQFKPRKIVISPGPGNPQSAGISVEVIKEFSGIVPILGVCLGHQAIGYAFGSRIIRAKNLMHGKTSKISHNGKDIFKALPNPFDATRYHSLVVDRNTLNPCLEVTAESEDGEIMALRHKNFSLWGIQFHPESILTKHGKDLLKNFLNQA